MPRTIAIITGGRQEKRPQAVLHWKTMPARPRLERYVTREWCVECANAGLKPEGRPPAKTFIADKRARTYVSSGACVQCARESFERFLAKDRARGGEMSGQR